MCKNDGSGRKALESDERNASLRRFSQHMPNLLDNYERRMGKPFRGTRMAPAQAQTVSHPNSIAINTSQAALFGATKKPEVHKSELCERRILVAPLRHDDSKRRKYRDAVNLLHLQSSSSTHSRYKNTDKYGRKIKPRSPPDRLLDDEASFVSIPKPKMTPASTSPLRAQPKVCEPLPLSESHSALAWNNQMPLKSISLPLLTNRQPLIDAQRFHSLQVLPNIASSTKHVARLKKITLAPILLNQRPHSTTSSTVPPFPFKTAATDEHQTASSVPSERKNGTDVVSEYYGNCYSIDDKRKESKARAQQRKLIDAIVFIFRKKRIILDRSVVENGIYIPENGLKTIIHQSNFKSEKHKAQRKLRQRIAKTRLMELAHTSDHDPTSSDQILPQYLPPIGSSGESLFSETHESRTRLELIGNSLDEVDVTDDQYDQDSFQDAAEFERESQSSGEIEMKRPNSKEATIHLPGSIPLDDPTFSSLLSITSFHSEINKSEQVLEPEENAEDDDLVIIEPQTVVLQEDVSVLASSLIRRLIDHAYPSSPSTFSTSTTLPPKSHARALSISKSPSHVLNHSTHHNAQLSSSNQLKKPRWQIACTPILDDALLIKHVRSRSEPHHRPSHTDYWNSKRPANTPPCRYEQQNDIVTARYKPKMPIL